MKSKPQIVVRKRETQADKMLRMISAAIAKRTPEQLASELYACRCGGGPTVDEFLGSFDEK